LCFDQKNGGDGYAQIKKKGKRKAAETNRPYLATGWPFLFPETFNNLISYKEYEMSDKDLKPVDEKSKNIFSSIEAEAQTVPAIVNQSEPEPESWVYMGTDSTAVIDISMVEVMDDDDQKAVSTWMGQIKKPSKGKKLPTEQLIEQGIELIRDITADANRNINLAHKYFAERAISIGLICIKLKELIKGTDKPWAAWAEENLPFIAKRNREKFMMIAKRQDARPFTFLGVDRLEMLCSVTKEMEGNDRIGDLFKKYEIPFDKESEMNLAEFKAMIDAAINNERLVRNGINVTFNLVTNIIALGVDFDKSLIRRLKDVQECGGNPESLLQKISLAGGKDEMDATPEKRLQDFNHLGNRLIKTLDFIMEDQDQLVKIDRETFRLLYERLISIQELGILAEDEGNEK